MSYFLFQDQTKGILASVVDGVEDVTGLKISNTLAGTGSIEGPLVPEVVLVPNAESDFVFTSSTGTITEYKGTRLDIVIPDSIGGVTVKVLGTELFMGKGITSVILPNNLTSIGMAAFYKNKLTSVTIPETVTSIGYTAFGENLLTSVTIPNSVTSIDGQAFRYNAITSITFGSGLKNIDIYAFANNLLTTVKVPKGLTNSYYGVILPYGVFANNPLTKAELPSGTTYITNSSTSGLLPTFPTGTIITTY